MRNEFHLPAGWQILEDQEFNFNLLLLKIHLHIYEAHFQLMFDNEMYALPM
jgi:hypothetical protein